MSDSCRIPEHSHTPQDPRGASEASKGGKSLTHTVFPQICIIGKDRGD